MQPSVPCSCGGRGLRVLGVQACLLFVHNTDADVIVWALFFVLSFLVLPPPSSSCSFLAGLCGEGCG